MAGLNEGNRRPNGAFKPITGCYSTDYPRYAPPGQFVASRLVGGLKDLFSQLSKSKNKQQTQESTNENGIFHHCKPVPNLATRYKVLQLIGHGQSSVLVAAEDLHHPAKQVVAIKIMNLDYKTLGAQEAECIQQLNRADPLKVSKVVRLLNKFMYDDHYCMAFELLCPRPLHQYFQRAEFDSEEEILENIREVTTQVLGVLGFLRRENVIHADLKPENILLESGEKMRIKVVDFGNAIHWIHQEMSLYYDNFELQTLLYRAPEVMFGVPFGPEIDMWSLGCIVAELYLGEPLFMGQSKIDVLKEMVSVLGPFPRIPFQSGKFYTEFSGFISSKAGPLAPSLEVRLMKKLRNMKNFTFANFLSGLLQYNPNNRSTPIQAASHPFLALNVPFADYLTNTEDEHHQDNSKRRRSGVLLTPSQYTYRPNIDDDVRRQHLSSIDLLRCGTGSGKHSHSLLPKTTSTPPVGRVVPLVSYEKTKSSEKEGVKLKARRGMPGLGSESDVDVTSMEQPAVPQDTQGRVLQGSNDSELKRLQKSIPLNSEVKFLAIPSDVLKNQNTHMLQNPAGKSQFAEENIFLLTNKTEGTASNNNLVMRTDVSHGQRGLAAKIVDEKAKIPIIDEFDNVPSIINETSRGQGYNRIWNDVSGSVSMESQNSPDNLEVTSARTRIYSRSKRLKSNNEEDCVLPGSDMSHSNCFSHTKELSFHENVSLKPSFQPKSFLSRSYLDVEQSCMSYATCDKRKDMTVEDYQFLCKTTRTDKQTAPSIKILDAKNSSNTLQRTILSLQDHDASSSNTKIFYSGSHAMESRKRQESSLKKNVKLQELDEVIVERESRKKGDEQLNSAYKRARRSLKLSYPHEDDSDVLTTTPQGSTTLEAQPDNVKYVATVGIPGRYCSLWEVNLL